MTAPQRDAAWLTFASAEEITAAFQSGQLRTVMGGPLVIGTIQRDEEWLKAATPEQIAAAHDAGELATLLGGSVNDLGHPVDGKGKVISR